MLSVLARGIQFLPTAQLTSEQYRPTVASNGVDVFFSDSSDAPLKKVSIEGGAIASLAAGEISQRLPRFTLSGSTLLVADGALIKSVPFPGGPVTTLLDAGSQPVDDIVADGRTVLVGFPGGGGGGASVRRIPLDGGPPTDYAAPVAPPGSSACLVRVAQDDAYVYWLASGATSPDDCAIWRAPTEGGSATALVEGVIVDFALSGQEIFFLERFRSPTTGNVTASAELKRMSVGGGAATSLSASGTRVSVDGAAIFLGIGSTLTIVPRSGAPSTTVPGTGAPGAVEVSNAFDDLSVTGDGAYLTDYLAGTVVRVAPVP